jgi:hypothetical protein
MILPDNVYNVLKWLLLTFTPALIVLISTLGVIYNFDTEVITLTIGAIATSIGALIGISNYNYKNK